MQRSYPITQLKEKILDSNARSIFVDAHPKKSIHKIDLISLNSLSKSSDPLLISSKLFSNEAFSFKFPIHYKKLSETETKEDYYTYYVKMLTSSMSSI